MSMVLESPWLFLLTRLVCSINVGAGVGNVYLVSTMVIATMLSWCCWYAVPEDVDWYCQLW